jgi:ketosteroid isomerase-like protein
MKSVAFRSTLAGVLTLTLFHVAAAAPTDDGAAAVASLERELVAAIAQKDLATYDRIVADDYVVFDSSGKQLTKADVVASYRTGTRGYTNLEIYDVVARVFGDTAIVTAKTKGFRHEDGRDVPNRVRYIRVFARRAGRWQAVTQMSAPMENPPEEKK